MCRCMAKPMPSKVALSQGIFNATPRVQQGGFGFGSGSSSSGSGSSNSSSGREEESEF